MASPALADLSGVYLLIDDIEVTAKGSCFPNQLDEGVSSQPIPVWVAVVESQRHHRSTAESGWKPR
jgi:hypothetical protein